MDKGPSPRPASDGELVAVAALEAACFSDPWTVPALASHAAGEGGGILVLPGADGAVAGYIIYRLLPPELEIYRIAVAPALRREGLGRALVGAALSAARAAGATVAFLDVRAGNTPAIGLYRRMGFVPIATRRDYYRAPREDALIMQGDLTHEIPGL